MMPDWLHVLALASLGVALFSAIVIAIDLASGRVQSMWIMNVVWPVTALWAGPLALWGYFKYGRAGAKVNVMAAKKRGDSPPNRLQPFPVIVGKGSTHCGAGCTLGDIVAESLFAFMPLSLWGHKIFRKLSIEPTAFMATGTASSILLYLADRSVICT